MFDDTVMNNVRYARFGATDEEVLDACKAACIHEQILGLTEGNGRTKKPCSQADYPTRLQDEGRRARLEAVQGRVAARGYSTGDPEEAGNRALG